MEDNNIKCEEIKKVLPHRYPFLLVDRVLHADAESVSAIKNVSINEPFFDGHFPEYAVMPGVLQIEAMAQAAGFIFSADDSFDPANDLAFLAGVDNAKFKRPVVPGDQLVLEAKVVAKKKGILKVAATATVDKKTVSSATITMIVKAVK